MKLSTIKEQREYLLGIANNNWPDAPSGAEAGPVQTTRWSAFDFTLEIGDGDEMDAVRLIQYDPMAVAAFLHVLNELIGSAELEAKSEFALPSGPEDETALGLLARFVQERMKDLEKRDRSYMNRRFSI